MHGTGPLTTGQIRHFKKRGYLVLENMIDRDRLEDWRSQLWAWMESSLKAPETWPRDSRALDGFRYDPPESAFGCYPALAAIIEQVGGGAFVGGGGAPIISWPTDAEWRLPETGHIDAYGPGGWSPFMIGATTYLYDVESGGGSFTYWPGSHHIAHRYLLRHPSRVDGSFREIEGWGWHVFSDGAPEGPREFTASAGSVVLWHAYLTHTGSMNVRATPRCGLFARWGHRRREERGFRYEVPEDLWKYWAI